MQQKHKYEYDIAPGGAPDRVVRMVGHQRRVLELGCGPGAITKHLAANGCRVTGLELDASAIELVSAFCENVHQCDFNDPNWPNAVENIGAFEVIVAADVFEHLYDPWRCLGQLHRFLAPHGSLVISIPHAGHGAIIACLLNSDFDYHPWGLLDQTHIRFFGLKNIQALFEAAGFKIIEVEFVVTHPADTELSTQWLRLGHKIQKQIRSIDSTGVYQVVLRAVPVAFPGKALELVTLAVPKPSGLTASKRYKDFRFGQYLASRLPPPIKRKLAKLINKISG